MRSSGVNPPVAHSALRLQLSAGFQLNETAKKNFNRLAALQLRSENLCVARLNCSSADQLTLIKANRQTGQPDNLRI